MLANRLIICFFLFLLTSLSANGQLDRLNKLGAGALSDYGDSALSMGDGWSAVDYFSALTKKKPKDASARFRLGLAYKMSRQYEKAEAAFVKAYELDSEKQVKALYEQGIMQQMQGQYEQAAETLLNFRKKNRGAKDSKLMSKKVRLAVEGCNMARRLIDTIPLNVEIKHLPKSVNSLHIDFSPAISPDGTLIYGSLKDEGYDKAYKLRELDSAPTRKLYEAKLENGKWVDQGELKGPFNQAAMNSGNGKFSPDGERFFFSRCARNKKNKNICAIYLSRLEDGKWSTPEKLPEAINHPDYSSTMPCFGFETFRNRELLYFVSDRPEGKGGMDIWYSLYDSKKGVYRAAANCGSRINTSEDELSPYFDVGARTLYFSSNGKPGLGGLDVFKAVGEMRKWEPAENVGYPINTEKDELYYILAEDGESGFFTSNRAEARTFKHKFCCDDIFAFNNLPEPIPEKKDSVITELPQEIQPKLVGRVIETDPADPVEKIVGNALITLYELENGKRKFVRSVYSKKDGKYDFKLIPGLDYEITVSKDGYFSKTLPVEKSSSGEPTIKKDLKLEQLAKGPIIIKNIYYEFDKADLTPESKAAIDKYLYPVLSDNPSIIVEISSHTDSKGNDSYNRRLSQQRAESVVRYLKEKGLKADRLQAKGYGESVPIAANKNEDGSDNPEGRQKNRRTEFRVVGQIDQDVQYKE